jgi:general secretion pathway protein D
MIEALKYITSLAGLKYRVESSAVVLLPVDAVDVTEMTTRSYNVSPDSIRALITGAAGGMAPPAPQLGGGGAIPAAPVVPGAVPAGGGAGAGGSEELKTFFVNAGVPFPPGSSLQYFERARTIYVRNTPENLEIFEKVLATFNVVPSQVEIESKFIEITQTDLDELGFQFGLGTMQIGTRNPNPHTTVQGMMGAGLPMGQQGYSPATNLLPGAVGWISQGLRGAGIFKGNAVDSLLVGATKATTLQDALASFQGVLNGASAQMIINALSQKKSADVLSAPKVTTISGAQAQIRVVQEFIYPSEYSQPAVADGALPTPSIPTAFKTREVGVILNVTPTVGADGYTINLTLVPEVSAFLGMLDYSPDPIVAIQSNFNAAIMVPYKIWQPLFETRNLTTSIVIWDGQTVVLGGLIREEVSKIDDKVPFLGDIPFLGRLFRSKSNSRIKRNLLVFVTARLIDPAGNLIHRPDTPGFRFDPNGNVIRGPEPALSTRP